jgi:hypothetical protein
MFYSNFSHCEQREGSFIVLYFPTIVKQNHFMFAYIVEIQVLLDDHARDFYKEFRVRSIILNNFLLTIYYGTSSTNKDHLVRD